MKDGVLKTRLEDVKYYASLILGTICIVSIFAFLFLVPFVLDPAISTLMHEFADEPVTCKVSRVDVKHGKSNCTWSSCREGCTADMYRCYQVRVVYAKVPHRRGDDETAAAPPRSWMIADDDWVDLSRRDRTEDGVVVSDTPLLVNIKGCGYPPDIACAAFADHYDKMLADRSTFPCYYSKLNPWIVLESYDSSEMIASIVASLVVPNGIFVVSLVILLCWYCPYCRSSDLEDVVEETRERQF